MTPSSTNRRHADTLTPGRAEARRERGAGAARLPVAAVNASLVAITVATLAVGAGAVRAQSEPATPSGLAQPTAQPTSAPPAASSWDIPATATEGDEAIQVVVGPGAQERTPMAVPEVRCFGAPADVCRTVQDVLRRDMMLSFMFRVLPPRSYLVDQAVEALDAPRWQSWRDIGARWLVKAEVRGPAPYQLSFRLFDVDRQARVPVARDRARDVAKRDIRVATHRFANDILKAITGAPGVFDTRLAYTQRTGVGVKAIGLVDMDGANRGLLVANGSINMLPAWGFGGVLYTSFLAGKPDVYFGKRRFSRDSGHYRSVAVSPDGSKVVASISYGGQADLYVLGKDGDVLRNLTDSPWDEVSPTFSPDGQRIAFVSSASGGPQIHVMSVAGGGAVRLTHQGSYNYAPDWGPDGRIVFAGLDGGRSDIFVVDAGGAIERLTQNQGSNKDPTWSPDGRSVAFVSSREDGTGLWLMSADGRFQVPVVRGGGLSGLAWQR